MSATPNKDLADVIYSAVEALIRVTGGSLEVYGGIVFAVSAQLAARLTHGTRAEAMTMLELAVKEGYASGERGRA